MTMMMTTRRKCISKTFGPNAVNDLRSFLCAWNSKPLGQCTSLVGADYNYFVLRHESQEYRRFSAVKVKARVMKFSVIFC